MIMDEEVQAVVIALVVVASVFASAMIIRSSKVVEPFDAIGLLNEECKIGEYPRSAVVGENLTLCIFLYNHMGRVEYFKVVYKIGTNETLPTNSSPSPEPPLKEWRFVLDHDENVTRLVTVAFRPPERYWNASRVALIFELWRYDAQRDSWVYDGRWVHLYVKPIPPLLGG